MKLRVLFLIATSITSAPAALFFDDFSSGSVTDQVNGYIGGWYGSTYNFNQWYGPGANAQISDGSLIVSSDYQLRSAVMLFEPSLFTDGVGQYSVTVNVSGYDGAANNSGLVSVWSGSGYDLSGATADAIFVSTQEAPFTALGNATVAELSSQAITATGVYTLNFTYDGTSAIGVFLSALTDGYPHPTVEYGSMTLASASPPIPEPSTTMLGGMAICTLLLRRKRTGGR